MVCLLFSLYSHSSFINFIANFVFIIKTITMSLKKLIYVPLLFIPLLLNAQSLQEGNFEKLKPYLHQQTDTVYVVNFWATWCVPCVEELPHFLTTAQDYSNKPVKFLFVSLDFPKNKESRLIPFIKDKHINEEVFLLNDPNSNKWINQVNNTWSGAIPATIIYKKNDRFFNEGELSYDELIAEIEKKLK